MNRRQIVTTLAVAAIMPLSQRAFAQEAQPMAGMEMGEAEAKHSQDTMRVGALALATSRVALSKASEPMVKQFAQFEVAEQETIADILMSMKVSPQQARGALKPPAESEVVAMLDQTGKDLLQKLQSAEAGKAFDAEYVTAQIDGHQKLLAIQEEYLQSGRNREHLNVTKLARGMIKEHLVILDHIKTMRS